MSLCQHCHKNKAGDSRGLCRACWDVPAIRRLYPARNPFPRDWHEPTEAELNALIEEQRKSLPPWWEDETERAREVEFHR